MDYTLALKTTNWTTLSKGSCEEKASGTSLKIQVRDHVVTKILDKESSSVRDVVHVSAYPLALWLASSWWRLRWEPYKTYPPTFSWRMAHEMPSAGHGYIWPPLTLASEGDEVEIACLPHDSSEISPIEYLTKFRETIPASSFEHSIDSFIQNILQRLDQENIKSTDLQLLWNEVLQERLSPEATQYRKFEALSGYDPDEAPEALIEELIQLSAQAGTEAVQEIAPCIGQESSMDTLKKIQEFANEAGIEGKIELPSSISNSVHKQPQITKPWELGWSLAKIARKELGISTGPIDDTLLSDILQITPKDLLQNSTNAPIKRLGLALQCPQSQKLVYHFRQGVRTTKRFEAARFLGDYILSSDQNSWYPTTNFKTKRQKIQRAFAAEFLCPIEELSKLLDNDFSEESWEEGADTFGVSPFCISSHLANNSYIPSERVPSAA